MRLEGGKRKKEGVEVRKPSIYVASPLGFTEPTRRFYREELLPQLADAGFDVLDPWADLGPVESKPLVHGSNNVRLLERADGVLAVLDGTDVDSGTAAEIGYAMAKGIPIVGIRTDTRRSGESASVTVNLQVEYFIVESGGSVFREFATAIKSLYELLA